MGGVWPGIGFGKGTLTLSFSLLLHFVSEGTKVINDMSNLVIQSTQIPNKSLSLILLQVIFRKELFKLPSIFLHTLSNLLEIVVILKVMGGKELGF